MCKYFRQLTQYAPDTVTEAWCAHPSASPTGGPSDDSVKLTCDGMYQQEGRCPIKEVLEREGYV